MAKQSLAMMVFMAMVSEGYAVRVGARTEAQDALLAKIASKVKENENLKPLEKLINGLKNAETLDASQVGMLPAMAERCEVDSADIDMTAVKTELAKIQMVLDAIESELPEHQSSQSVHGATDVSDPKTTMLLEIKTVVESGELADQIFEHVTDEATAKSFVDDLLWEAEDNAARNAKKNVLSAIASELQEHQSSQSVDGATVVPDTKTTMLLGFETMVRQGKLADDIRGQVGEDKESAESFVRALLLEAEQNAKRNVLSAIASELREHQSSQSVDGATVVSYTMLREIETKVRKGEFADKIRERVTDKASAKSFVAFLLLEAKENADMELRLSDRKNRVGEVLPASAFQVLPAFQPYLSAKRNIIPYELHKVTTKFGEIWETKECQETDPI